MPLTFARIKFLFFIALSVVCAGDALVSMLAGQPKMASLSLAAAVMSVVISKITHMQWEYQVPVHQTKYMVR